MTEQELTALEALLLQQSKLGPINIPRSAMRSAADAIAELRRERDEARAGVARRDEDKYELYLAGKKLEVENAALKERVARLEAALRDAKTGLALANEIPISDGKYAGVRDGMLIALQSVCAALDVKGAG